MTNNLSKGFIKYQARKTDGNIYAVHRVGERQGSKIISIDRWLGKVIDKDKNIFYNKKYGYFTYTVEDGLQSLNNDEANYFRLISSQPEIDSRPLKILNFGDSFVLDNVLHSIKFIDVLTKIKGINQDTLMSLIHFKLCDNGANRHAASFWNSSYTKILYPNASLQSQRISEFYKSFGVEDIKQNFLYIYYKFLNKRFKEYGILLDSSGMPNDIQFYLTKNNAHQGVISNEIRLILVIDKLSSLPLFFNYVPGNIVDVTTLKKTILTLKQHKIKIKDTIMDAGYYSKQNILAMYEQKIDFLTRLSATNLIYKTLISKHSSTIQHVTNLVQYKNRPMFIKIEKVDLYGNTGYAYICLDVARFGQETVKYSLEFLNSKIDLTDEEAQEKYLKLGMFILISSRKISINDVLPLYYTRQAIEQVFDYSKNDVDLLPLRIHGEKALRGHLLLSFICSIVDGLFNIQLEGTNFGTKAALKELGYLHCNLYENKIITDHLSKQMNDITKHLKISIPDTIKLKI
ncbi:MAG: transposase [Rickettsiales bacterium]|jgi:hypothetical protein|nr:transposase [Rickettsiales bacterium]